MEPEERVKSFIASYFRAHQQLHAEMLKDRTLDKFDRWDALIAELDVEHGINLGCMDLAEVIDGFSPHVPGDELVISIRKEQERTYVETRMKDYAGSLSFFYYEYELLQSNGDWRIGRIRDFLCPEDEPYMTDKERPRFTNPPVFPLRKLPASDTDANGDALFISGRQIQLDDRTSSIEVRPVGRLNVTTGRLVVGDLGYDVGGLGVIGQCVSPGEYAVDVSIAFDRIAALRVRFSNESVARWHPADRNGGKSPTYVVGVDAGNMAIMDLAAVMSVKYRDKERAFEIYRENPVSRCSMLALAHANDTVISDSGWGDGRYPVYWGVDKKRRPVVLVVDFDLFPREEIEK